MGWNSAGFEIGNALDRRAYPTARPKRSGPPPTDPNADPSAGAPPSPPRTRIVDFKISVNANVRSTRSFGPIQGPAVIKRARYDFDNIAGSDGFFFEVGYNPSPVEEALVAVTTPWSWSVVTERLPQQGTDFDPSVRGFVNSVGISQKVQHERIYGYVVRDAQFYLTMTVGQAGGAANAVCRGYVVVIGGLTYESLAFYTGD